MLNIPNCAAIFWSIAATFARDERIGPTPKRISSPRSGSIPQTSSLIIRLAFLDQELHDWHEAESEFAAVVAISPEYRNAPARLAEVRKILSSDRK